MDDRCAIATSQRTRSEKGTKPLTNPTNAVIAAPESIDLPSGDPAEVLLEGLTPEQKHAATSSGPTLVVAGAGTGKTKTLTSAVTWRIAKQGVPSNRIMAVTFTNKAAGEMERRIRDALGSSLTPRWIGTFHGLSSRMLRKHPEIAGLKRDFSILDTDDARSVLKRAVRQLATDEGRDETGGTGRETEEFKSLISKIKRRIEWFKDNVIGPDEAPGIVERLIEAAEKKGEPLTDAMFQRKATRVYSYYQKALKETNCADFGDLLLWPTWTMTRNETFRQHLANQFDCLLADEYQDVNRVQYEWLRLLSTDHQNLFVVGDDDQAIYSWRGSDISYIRRFTTDYPEATVHRLEQNFRSTSHIISAANAIIEKNQDRLGKVLKTDRGTGHRIEIVPFYNPEDEAEGIAEEIRRRVASGLDWDDFGILYRANHISRVFEEVLLRNRMPHVIIGDLGFWARAEIKDALAFLQLVAYGTEKQSDAAFMRVANRPTRGLGDKAMMIIEDKASQMGCSMLEAIAHADLSGRAKNGAKELQDAIKAASASHNNSIRDQLELVLEGTGYIRFLAQTKTGEGSEKLGNIQELLNVTEGYESITSLLEHAVLSTSESSSDDKGKIRLMSIHRAKGLEFYHVFLPAWEQGIMPNLKNGIDNEEERRLAYVALTRGMDRVTISHASVRFSQGSPSSFIDDIPEEHCVHGWIRDQAKRRRRVDEEINISELLEGF